MDGGVWWAAVHEVTKSRTRLSNFTLTFPFHALEKEMATHSSVFAWRIPRTGEPGGLPSMGSHRVGHDWSDLAAENNTESIQQMELCMQIYFLWPSQHFKIWISCKHLIARRFHIKIWVLGFSWKIRDMITLDSLSFLMIMDWLPFTWGRLLSSWHNHSHPNLFHSLPLPS